MFSFFINAIYWGWLFLAGLIPFGAIAYWVYDGSSIRTVAAVMLLAVGVVSGVILAEYVRKKYGLTRFFGKVISTSGIDSNSKEE